MGKKKYIKNSKGVTMSVTTDTLGLEKPLLNENYDIDVHNRNMDKIDEDLKPIDDSYIIELFQHDGDTTNPRDYYTKVEADERFATKEEANNALNKANEAFQRGDNVKTQLVDKLISEGLNVSTDNTFDELISGIALGKKWATGTATSGNTKINVNLTDGSTGHGYLFFTLSGLDFKPSLIFYVSKSSNSGFGILSNLNQFNAGFSPYIFITTTNPSGSESTGVGGIKADSVVFLNDGSIRVPCFYSEVTYSWIAFE